MNNRHDRRDHRNAQASNVTWHCRQATPDDMDRIVELSKQNLSLGVPHSKRMVAGMLAACNSGYFVAVLPKTGEIVGFIGITCTYGRCSIYPMAVDKRFRRLGVATALLTVIKVKCEQFGADSVSTLVQERDVPMQLLLWSNGFVCHEVTADGYSFIWRPEWLGSEVDDRKPPAMPDVVASPVASGDGRGCHADACDRGGSGDMVPVEEFANFATCVVESVRRNITDDAVLGRIAADLEYLLGGGPAREFNFTITADPRTA